MKVRPSVKPICEKCKKNLAEMQDYQAQGPYHGHLREPEAQAEAGLITLSLGSKTGRIAWAAAQTLFANHAAFHKRNPAEHITVIGYRR